VGLILLDSTVIVGFLDSDDALHDASVSRLKELAGKPLTASVISYAEVMTGARRGHHPEEKVEGFFNALIQELLPVDKAVAARAAALRGQRKSLRMPDALILASADSHPEVDTVLYADADWTKIAGLDCRIELLSPGPDG
jgi:predicted nucleic acid-binding protein